MSNIWKPEEACGMAVVRDDKHLGVVVEFVLVTAEIAELWLEQNLENRAVSPERVASYALDMTANNWKFTGDPIKFDWDGRLIDGQHRLLAIIRSGCTVRMLIAKGINPTAQTVIDTGKKRTSSHALQMVGYRQAPTIVAAAARIGLTEEAGKLLNAKSTLLLPTHSEVIGWVEQNTEIEQWAQLSQKYHRAIAVAPSPLAYAMYTIIRLNGAEGIRFFDDLYAMKTEGEGDPKATLLKRLRQAVATKERISAAQVIFAIYRSWNAVKVGEELKLIKFANGANPSEIPTIAQ
ncbi:hypothetical protein [Arthrobacter woluwensis]|nr:hypothetical protein [Arthrobacter woluwensis]